MIDASIQDQAVTQAMKALQKKTSNRRGAHSAITRRLVTRVQGCFRTGRDPWGNAWEPLKGRSGQPLRDTGRLLRSIPAASASDASSSTVGTNVRYGLTHQEGRTITAQPGNPGSNFVGQRKGSPFLRFQIGGRWVQVKQVEIPARPFLPIKDGQISLPNEWRASVLDAIEQHIKPGALA